MESFFQRPHHGKQFGFQVLFRGQDKHPFGKVGVSMADGLSPRRVAHFAHGIAVHVHRNTQ
jgi:hypothetical protein